MAVFERNLCKKSSFLEITKGGLGVDLGQTVFHLNFLLRQVQEEEHTDAFSPEPSFELHPPLGQTTFFI
jgi:hypothetical protein